MRSVCGSCRGVRSSSAAAPVPAARPVPHVVRPRCQAKARRSIKARVSDPFTTPLPQERAASRAGAPTQSPEFGADYFTAEDSRPIILFDGVCNLCNGGVNFVLDWDTAGEFRFAALQSPAGKALLQRSGRSADDISSIVLVTRDRHYVKSHAVMKIAQDLKMPLPAVAFVSHAFPDDFKNTVYDWVAVNRYKFFGESPQCRLMQPEWRDRFLA